MPTHAVTHYDPATYTWIVTFLPCRHRITFTVEDTHAAQATVVEAQVFALRQRICWECVYQLEAPDA